MPNTMQFKDLNEDGSGTVIIVVDNASLSGKIQLALSKILQASSEYIYSVDENRDDHLEMRIKFSKDAFFSPTIINALFKAKADFNLKLNIAKADQNTVFEALQAKDKLEDKYRRAPGNKPLNIKFTHEQEFPFDELGIKSGEVAPPRDGRSPQKRKG